MCYSMEHNAFPLVFAASWNEQGEGHYLEPDGRHGFAWLEAVRDVKLHVLSGC